MKVYGCLNGKAETSLKSSLGAKWLQIVHELDMLVCATVETVQQRAQRLRPCSYIYISHKVEKWGTGKRIKLNELKDLKDFSMRVIHHNIPLKL